MSYSLLVGDSLEGHHNLPYSGQPPTCLIDPLAISHILIHSQSLPESLDPSGKPDLPKAQPWTAIDKRKKREAETTWPAQSQ